VIGNLKKNMCIDSPSGMNLNRSVRKIGFNGSVRLEILTDTFRNAYSYGKELCITLNELLELASKLAYESEVSKCLTDPLEIIS
jgi:hypothetical protein